MIAAMDRIPNPVFRFISVVVIALLLIAILIPIYFMLSTAFKVEAEIYSELTWIPQRPTLDNFRDVIVRYRIPLFLRNTLIVATATTVLTLSVSLLAAFALARLRFPGRAVMARGVLFVYLVPASLMLIPMYLIIANLKLINSYLGLIIANMSYTVPFCTWLLMGYLRGISTEMEEAALIDGCTRLSTLWYIVIPLLVPGIVIAGTFIFNAVWNEFVFALVLAQDDGHRMISVGLSNFYGIDFFRTGPMMAGSLIALAPPLILYILAQRYVVSGLAAGAIKG
jgi:ABC-type glycerol-3-phosphate transport system permease component